MQPTLKGPDLGAGDVPKLLGAAVPLVHIEVEGRGGARRASKLYGADVGAWDEQRGLQGVGCVGKEGL